MINGQAAEYFRSTRGLRQGCPLSPFLFTIIIELFSSMLSTYAASKLISTPFQRGEVSISHLRFASDVMVFCRSFPWVARNIKALPDNSQ